MKQTCQAPPNMTVAEVLYFLIVFLRENVTAKWDISMQIVVTVIHFVKSFQIRSFSGPYFPVFGLNTEIYGVNLCVQYEYGKMRTRRNSVFLFYFIYLTFI